MDDNPNGKRRAVRALAEKEIQSERTGEREKADELLAEAERTDPDETLEVFREAGTRDGG